MRSVVLWFLLTVALAAAGFEDEPIDGVEEEDVGPDVDEDVSYALPPQEEEDVYYRRRREIHQPSDEHIRVKRCCGDRVRVRVRRSAEYVRTPRQVYQYEVHELTDEQHPASPPYEEMLAASADHYHRVYAAPDAPNTATYLNPDVSPTNVLSVPLNHQPSNHAKLLPFQSSVLSGSNEPDTNAPVMTLSQLRHRQLSQSSPFLSKLQAPAQLNVPIASSPAAPREALSAPAPAHPVPLQQLDGDQSAAATGHQHSKHAHGHSQGGGYENHGKNHQEHGGKTTKGFHQKHYVDKGGKGHKLDEHHRKEYEEALGKKKKHHDEAAHKGGHEEQAHGHRGANFDEKKGHKKGHKTKGYHNKYHKDEFHKEHKFYDDYHKSGEHHRYGKFNAKHASDESGNKKAHRVNAGHDFLERGNKGYSNKGHVDADHKGHDGKQGHEEHHHSQSSHGKKGGKEGQSHWGYAKKN